MGAGALGKSKLLHQLCQEICIAYDMPQYVFGKAVDPLGILSHAGELRKSGAIALTDFDLAASRGRSYGHEALKSLLDVPEGGCIKDTRWRPATIPKDKPRLLALNGDIESYGAWFWKYEQCAIATMIDCISAATEPDISPTERARRWAAAAIQAP
jgi:hypothetical protein